MYPAPNRQPWSWAVEFHDGTRIVGMSAEDVCERWGRILGQVSGHALDLPELISAIARYATRSCPLLPDFGAFIRLALHPDAEAFLHHLQQIKLIDLLRK